MTFDELTNRLENVKHTGQNKILASCPCQGNHKHGDRNRSLSAAFDPATGKILLYCFTGCRIDEICAALDITQADLAPDARAGDPQRDFLEWYGQQNGLRLEAVYNYAGCNDGMAKVKYRDAGGKKTFRWIHADAGKKSGFAMGQGDCKHRLYVRGDLTAADVVFLTEGEKDADTVYNLFGDMPAVCTENGAGRTNQGGKWRDEYTAQLAGKHVYILFDNDAAGRAFADIEAAALQDAAAAVYMLDLLTVWEACPDGGDISDLAAEFGAEEAAAKLSVLASDARPRSAPQDAAAGSEPQQEPLQGLLTVESAAAILDSVDSNFLEIKAFPQLSAMLKIRTHDTIVMAGDTGAGKSSLALNFLYGLQDRYPAMYINLEMDAATVLQRLVAIHTGIQLDEIEGYKHDSNTRSRVNAALQAITARQEIQLLNDLYNIKDIETQIQTATQGRTEPTAVFIDTGLLVTTPSRTGSRYERFTEISEELRRISRLYNVVMFVLLQQNRQSKAEERTPTNSSLKESGSWENDATKVFFLWQNQDKQREILVTKNRSGKTGSIILDYSPHTQRYQEAKEAPAGFHDITDDADPLPDGWDTMPERSSRRGRK